jgi:hypothetical protein
MSPVVTTHHSPVVTSHPTVMAALHRGLMLHGGHHCILPHRSAVVLRKHSGSQKHTD